MQQGEMNESSSWSIYNTTDGDSSEGPRTFSTSMNAVSYGFVATAILISMFLIMAIFEHIFSPENSSFDSPHRIGERQSHIQKFAHQASMVQMNTVVDVSVVMPGEKLPSHIALPAPIPCGKEGIHWPLHL